MEEINKIDLESISKLTDEELFRELKKNNLKTGPITGTTRFLYEKRLRYHLYPELVEQEANSPSSNFTETSAISESKPPQESEKIQTETVTIQPELIKPVIETTVQEEVQQIEPQEIPSSPKQTRVDESPKPSSKSSISITPRLSPSREKEIRERLAESNNSSADSYLNTSGIRGRGPLRRQNSDIVQSTTPESSGAEQKKGSSFMYFVMAFILAFVIYMVLIYIKDTTQHSVEF
ncbi:unnamed protein product [Brachionus calyciflorus]|uniref:LEM domain-containing protein n=1 Tax=Brachionus calyciflorus TaxID=104777 RepID=A0A814PCR7_9BILA|nr:unnamed protein product [Brachionus calyciflorus]